MITDILAFICVIYFTIRGCHKGIWRSLVGPLSFLISFAGSQFFFSRTPDLMMSLLILIIGPLVFSVLLAIIIHLWETHVTLKEGPSLFSQWLGGFWGLIWGIAVVVIALLSLALFSKHIFRSPIINDNIARSYSYGFIEKFVKNKLPFVSGLESLMSISQNPDKLRDLQSSPEFRSVYKHPKIQEMLSDKKTIQQIQHKDLIKLLENPRIMEIWRDENLMRQVMNLGNVLSLEDTAEKKLTTDEKPAIP